MEQNQPPPQSETSSTAAADFTGFSGGAAASREPAESPRAPPRQNTNGVKDATPKKPKQCNCKHSRCLKLYCECFRDGMVCNGGCNCVNCHNNEDNNANKAARDDAINTILERNRNAFRPKTRAASPHGA